MPNRLAAESSPYLLQHSNNPVDWFPWGNEALERAKSKDLPIIEAAVSSGILSEFELKHFQPNELVTRREFLTWIYNYHDHGTRQVKMEADQIFKRNQRSFRYNSGLKSRFSIEKRNRQQSKIFAKRKSREKNNLSVKKLRFSPNTFFKSSSYRM